MHLVGSPMTTPGAHGHTTPAGWAGAARPLSGARDAVVAWLGHGFAGRLAGTAARRTIIAIAPVGRCGD